MTRGIRCDTCGGFNPSFGSLEDKPWNCPVCGKEACSKCFYKYATHKKCCEGKSDEELIKIADEKGFNFSNK